MEYFTEQQRENDRSLRRAGRDIERERRKLEDEEKKIVSVSRSISRYCMELNVCLFIPPGK